MNPPQIFRPKTRRRIATSERKKAKGDKRAAPITAEQQQRETPRLALENAERKERLKIHEEAQRSINKLIRLAESGDQLSVILLVMIASQMIDAVNSGVEQRPELFLKFSRDQFVWPALISRKRAIKLENARLMETL